MRLPVQYLKVEGVVMFKAKIDLIRQILEQAKVIEQDEQAQGGVYIGGGALVVIVIVLLLIMLL
jgi:hypothetical protein